MAETIKNKIYKLREQSGAISYQVLPGTNTPYGMTEVTDPNEVTNYIKELKAMPIYVAGKARETGQWFDAQQQAKTLEAEMARYQASPDSGLVASYRAPWGETLTNVPQVTIDQIEKEQQQAASGQLKNIAPAGKPPMYVPTGSPGDLLKTNPAEYARLYGSVGVPGATPNAQNGVTTGVSGQGGTTPYTIQKGDTLSALAAKNGVTVQALLKANPNITNPDLIYAGASLNIPGKTIINNGESPVSTSAGAAGTNDAAEVAKKAAEAAKATADQEAEIRRLTNEKALQDLKTSLGIDTGKPAKPTYESDFEALKSKEGITAIETQLNEVKDTRQTLLDARDAAIKAESTRIGSKESVSIRQTKIKDSYVDQLNELDRRESRLTDQYNTAMKSIELTMNFKEKDYEEAQQIYQQDFSNSLQLYNILKSNESEEKQIAGANLTIITNYLTEGIKNGKIDPNNIPQDIKNTMTKLELQQGLIPGFTASLMSMINKDKETRATITSDDKSTVTVLYKDGTSETFKTGIYEAPSESDLTEAELERKAVTDMKSQLKGVAGSDGFISPDSWKKARQAWIERFPGKGDVFDETFAIYKNPDNPYYE